MPPFLSFLSVPLSSPFPTPNSPTMEQPPPPSTTGAVAAAVAASAPYLHYPISVNSSPLSPNTNSVDEKPIPPISAAAAGKLRLMCSYGGQIIPRPRDKSLCYVGGETRMVVADRRTTLSDLTNRLSKTLLHSRSFTLKYQLPNEDLDSLISVNTDDDLENMIDEYDRLTTTAAGKSSRIRLFLFPEKSDLETSIGSLIENSTKSEEWFLDVLNGLSTEFSNSSSVNCLLGLDDDVPIAGNLISEAKEFDSQLESIENFKRDVHSMPDSPLMEMRSSFGSALASPLMANMPPTRVQVEDQKVGVGGFEEQFSQMSFGAALSTQATVSTGVVTATAVSGVPVGSPVVVSGEYSNWVQAQVELQTQALPLPPKSAGGLDLPSPDSVSSDGSVTNPLSHQRTMIFQDPIVRIPSGNNRIPNYIDRIDQKSSDPNSQVQLQQVQDSNYVFPTQFEQQQQQFIQGGSHYIHHNSSGSVPITSYYPIYPSPSHQHHTLDPQYPVYYVPARQTQTSNLPVQQSNSSEPNASAPALAPAPAPAPYTRSQTTPPQPATYNPMRNAPPLAQVPSNQHRPQYLGFSQIHPSSQSIAPNAVVKPNYAYEFSDPSHAQMYYAQYQTMTSSSGVGLSEASSQLSTANMKQQQIRTSQP